LDKDININEIDKKELKIIFNNIFDK
jgi:hypothetical protein